MNGKYQEWWLLRPCIQTNNKDKLRFYTDASLSREIWATSNRSLQDLQGQREKLNNERKNQYQTSVDKKKKKCLTYWNAIINLNILIQTLFSFKLPICLSTQGDSENRPVLEIHWNPDYSRTNRCGDAQGQSSNFTAKLWYVVVRKNAFFSRLWVQACWILPYS